MQAQIDRKAIRRRVRRRIRRKVTGTTERPRIAVFRSSKHIYAQAIDDRSGRTLAHASTRDADVRAQVPSGSSVAAAKTVGSALAAKLKAVGVKGVVFDRGGFVYHGRIKAVADAVRESGIEF